MPESKFPVFHKRGAGILVSSMVRCFDALTKATGIDRSHKKRGLMADLFQSAYIAASS